MIEEGWPRILRWQANGKSMRTLSDSGNSEWPLERKLFGTTPSPYLFNTRTLSIQQPTTMMKMNPFMAIVPINVLCIELPKYHDNDDHAIHIQQLTKSLCD